MLIRFAVSAGEQLYLDRVRILYHSILMSFGYNNNCFISVIYAKSGVCLR